MSEHLKVLMDEIAPDAPSDAFAKRLIEILSVVTDENGDFGKYCLSRELMRYAYTKSQEFEDGFAEFTESVPALNTVESVPEMSEVLN